MTLRPEQARPMAISVLLAAMAAAAAEEAGTPPPEEPVWGTLSLD